MYFRNMSRLILLGAVGSDSKKSACSTGDLDSIPGQEDHWKRACQTTLIFLPRNPHGQRIMVGYSPWGRQTMES